MYTSDSLGIKSINDRITVRPPNPESNTPIGDSRFNTMRFVGYCAVRMTTLMARRALC